jgi:hypothetical protein
MLHEWMDAAALLEAVPESARKVGFGGVGFLVDALRDSSRTSGAGSATAHIVHSIRMGGPDRYRVDLIRESQPSSSGDERHGRRRNRNQVLTIACDGERRWQVCADRVIVGPAGPPAGQLPDLLDASWLLSRQLTGGSEIVVGGRRAYRVIVSLREPSETSLNNIFGRFLFPAVVVVDAESGRLLRVTVFKGGKPVTRQELRDVTPLAPDEGDFSFEVPDGLPVEEEKLPEYPASSSDFESSGEEPPDEEWEPRMHTINPVEAAAKAAADALKERLNEKAAAARDFLDSLRGQKPPPRD